jgi:hypothetical protein
MPCVATGGNLPHWCGRRTAAEQGPHSEVRWQHSASTRSTFTNAMATGSCCGVIRKLFKEAHTAGLNPLQAASRLADQAHVAGCCCGALQSARHKQ